MSKRLVTALATLLLLIAVIVFAVTIGPGVSLRHPTGSATIHIDSGQHYQTLEGFGGYGAQQVWWSDGPYFDQPFVDTLVNDLGITILRDSLPTGFEPINDNSDPNDLDLSRFNITASVNGSETEVIAHLNYLAALKKAGLERFVISVWSPPPWMKHNQAINNGTERFNSAPAYTTNPDQNSNQLIGTYYEEFAEYCVAYIQLLKNELDIDLYAISLQNEPRFSQFYASNVHSPESLRDLIKVVGARFQRENINTKIFAPEDVASFDAISLYLKAILDDPQANQFTDIFAVHNYKSDGINPSDLSKEYWQKTLSLANQAGKAVWMSETSGFDGSNIAGGISLARSIYTALEFGNVSAWIYWQMSDNNPDKHGRMIVNGEKNFLYYASKQFYRHLRPGMVRIKAQSNHANLLSLAFIKPGSDERVMILINTSNEVITAALSDEHAGRFKTAYITNEHSRHEDFNIKALGPIDVPGLSIVTLTSNALH